MMMMNHEYAVPNFQTNPVLLSTSVNFVATPPSKVDDVHLNSLEAVILHANCQVAK